MPLKSGTSKAAFEANVRAEIAAGKSRAQALAIAYSMQRRSKKTASAGRSTKKR